MFSNGSIDWNMVVAIATVLGLIFTVWAFGKQSNQTRLSTQLDILMRFDEIFWSEEFRLYRYDLAERCAKALPSEDQDDEIIDFFTGLGLVVKRGAVDLKIADEFLGYWAINYYYLLGERILNSHNVWESYTWLYQRLTKKVNRDPDFITYELKRLQIKRAAQT